MASYARTGISTLGMHPDIFCNWHMIHCYKRFSSVLFYFCKNYCTNHKYVFLMVSLSVLPEYLYICLYIGKSCPHVEICFHLKLTPVPETIQWVTHWFSTSIFCREDSMNSASVSQANLWLMWGCWGYGPVFIGETPRSHIIWKWHLRLVDYLFYSIIWMNH